MKFNRFQCNCACLYRTTNTVSINYIQNMKIIVARRLVKGKFRSIKWSPIEIHSLQYMGMGRDGVRVISNNSPSIIFCSIAIVRLYFMSVEMVLRFK